MSRSTSNRRDFLRSAAALTAAGAVVPYWLSGENAIAAETKSKNDRPQIGLIGVGGQGTYIAQQAARFGDVVAICDVDLRQAEQAKAKFGGKATVYQDYRKLLEHKGVDVVTNGTPDHWHTAITVAACNAGKDVYAEKPMTLTIDEGKQVCKVVEETKRIVQIGTMQRSFKEFQTAVELVRNGRIGKLKQVWVALPYYSTKGGPFAKQPVPSELNWDMFQGQAPVHDYCPERAIFNFRWWDEYAGGIITDWGNHHMDIAHWGMDCEMTGPTSVEARGVYPNPVGPDYFNTPDRFFSRMLYPNGVELLFFSSVNERMRPGSPTDRQVTTPEQIEYLFGKDVPKEIKSYNRNGIMFIGEQGKVFVNRGAVHGKAVEELKQNPLPADAWRAYPSSDHMANFFDCVKMRKTPCTPVQIEHRSITPCHLTNIAIRVKRKLTWDPKEQQIVGDDEANAMQKREQRAPYLVRA